MSAYSFQEVTGETTEDTLLRVCETIVSAGLMVRGDEISAGGNMVAVRSAVQAISDEVIENLSGSGNELISAAATAVSNMKAYLKDHNSAYLTSCAVCLMHMKNEKHWAPNVQQMRIIYANSSPLQGIPLQFIETFGPNRAGDARKSAVKLTQ